MVLEDGAPTTMGTRPRLPTIESGHTAVISPSVPPPSAPKEGDYFSVRSRNPSAGAPPTPDESGTSKAEDGLKTPITPGGGLMGRLKHFGKLGKKTPGDAGATTPQAEAVLDIAPEVRVTGRKN